MVTKVQGALAIDADFVLESEVGVANGVAGLDSGGKVPAAQLPPGSTGALSYQGSWNANTNSPALASGVGTQGYYYVVGTTGSTNLDGITDWKSGDWATYNGTAWEKIDNTDAVASVFTRTGAVTAAAGDYTAAEVTNVATGNIAATDVQAALNELDSEKAALSHTHPLAEITDEGALAALNTVGAAQIDNAAVTLAKMANMATASLLGRNTAGAGVPEVLSKTTALALLNVADGANAYVHPNHTGDVTSTGDGATVIGANKVTPAMLTKPDIPIIAAVSDEITAITVGTAKITFRMPFAMTLNGVRASLTTVSSSGLVTVDINKNGVTILSTKLTIDANEKTSQTAATAAVISSSALADDDEITIDIDGAGTGAIGLKVTLIGEHT